MTYTVTLRAETGVGPGAASQSATAMPVTTAAAPTNLVLTLGDRQLRVDFAAPADTGGVAITDYGYSVDGGTTSTGAGTTASPITITGLTSGATYTVALRAVTSVGPGAISDPVAVTLGSPATEFAAAEDDIRAVIVADVTRSPQSTIAVNCQMMRDARDRLLAGCDDTGGACAPQSEPFDINGTAEVNGLSLSTSGTFGAKTALNGDTQRLVFGSFDIQQDAETGSGTATLTARTVCEHMVSERTLLGYFLGGELTQSQIEGAFDGDQSRIGVTTGGSPSIVSASRCCSTAT